MKLRSLFVVTAVGLALFGGAGARADVCADVPATQATPARSVCATGTASAGDQIVCLQTTEGQACVFDSTGASIEGDPTVTNCSGYRTPYVPLPSPLPQFGLPWLAVCGTTTASAHGLTACEGGNTACARADADAHTLSLDANAFGIREHVGPDGSTAENQTCIGISLATCGDDRASVPADTPGAAAVSSQRCLVGYPLIVTSWEQACETSSASAAGASAYENSDRTGCIDAFVEPQGAAAPKASAGTC